MNDPKGGIQAILERWSAEEVVPRLFRKDFTIWAEKDLPELSKRLGWIDLPETMDQTMDEVLRITEEVRGAGLETVVLLGMGGSSLAPDLFAKVFGNRGGFPRLTVLDTTHPEAILRVTESLNFESTLFIVSSKSGGTLETRTLMEFFWHRVKEIQKEPGRNFIAITDPGSSLEQTARERGFRSCVEAPADVGGRFSALTPFGLLPAALLGIDLRALQVSARRMKSACEGSTGEKNPAALLAAAVGKELQDGFAVLPLETDSLYAPFADWLEQLLAESTGKSGRGILPVLREKTARPGAFEEAKDGFVVKIHAAQKEKGEEAEETIGDLRNKGYVIALRDPIELGGEFFRWEVATALLGELLSINPFDQPDVQLAKDFAKKVLEGKGRGEEIEEVPEEEVDRFLKEAVTAETQYIALQAFIDPSEENAVWLKKERERIERKTGRFVTVGFGPRFLHSTGQLHKGGPACGVFVQIVDEIQEDCPIPGKEMTFGRLIRGQADGDYLALRQRGRKVIRMKHGMEDFFDPL